MGYRRNISTTVSKDKTKTLYLHTKYITSYKQKFNLTVNHTLKIADWSVANKYTL